MSTNTKLAEALRRLIGASMVAMTDQELATGETLSAWEDANESLAAYAAAQSAPSEQAQVPMCSEHAVAHAVNQARSESHKQGDAAFQQAFARAMWRQFNAMLAAAPQPQQAAPALAFSDAVRIARGCTDYGGGHRGKDTYEVYQHGIQTVIAALEAAERRGLEDTQVRALHCMGAATPPQQAPAPQPVGLTGDEWRTRDSSDTDEGCAALERAHGIPAPQATQQEKTR